MTKSVAINPLRRVGFETVYRGQVPLTYCDHPNWGDALSPVLAGLLSGKPIKKMLWEHQHRYLSIGSILGNASSRSEVWGSGFMWPDQKVSGPPDAVHAVRGPRSRNKLLKMGIDCPEVYGDPALLFPKFYNPDIEKKYPVGIVPHYNDQGNPWVERYRDDSSVFIIDIQRGIEAFVDDVKSCDFILSSSLHGLICADSYGIPGQWIELSDIVWGSEFKFPDYFESIGREVVDPVCPSEDTPLAKVTQSFQPYTTKIDLVPLISSCPFIAPEVRERLLANPSLEHPS